MEGITVLDMAQELGIASEAVKRRLQRKGLVPFKYIGNAGIYKKSDLETVRECGKRGRPRTKAPEKPAPKISKKTTKKS